jgi:hypothetical protein
MSEENQVVDGQTEEIQEPPKVVLNDVEYLVSEMSEEGQYLYAQCSDLAKKKTEAEKGIFEAQFNADQVAMSLDGMQGRLAKLLETPAEEANTAPEAPVANT